MLGGIKIGTGLSIAGDGTVTASGSIVPATATVLGGVKVSTGLSVDAAGVLTVSSTQSLTGLTVTGSVSGAAKINGVNSTSPSTGALVVAGGAGISSDLYVGGQIVATGDITAFSDSRLKTSVVSIKRALNVINQLRGVNYNRIDNGDAGTGVIAEEVENVLPVLVKTSKDGMKSVAYGNFAGYFIEAIKELTEKVNSLQKEITVLKRKMTKNEKSSADTKTINNSEDTPE